MFNACSLVSAVVSELVATATGNEVSVNAEVVFVDCNRWLPKSALLISVEYCIK